MRSSLKKRKWVQRQEVAGAAVERTPPAPSASTYPGRRPRMCAAFCKKAVLSVTIRRADSQVPVQILSPVSLISASFEIWQLFLVSLKPLPCSHPVTAPPPKLAAIFLFKFLLGGCCYTLPILETNFSRMSRVQIAPLETKTRHHRHPQHSTQMSSHLLTLGAWNL